MIKKIHCYELKGSEKQLKEMYSLLEFEKYRDPKMTKYFDVWSNYPYGVFFFPKKEYFVSKYGNTNYEECLKEYRGY